MKGPIMDLTNNTEEFNNGLELLPKSVEYPVGVTSSSQLYTPDKISLSCPSDKMLIESIPMNSHKPVKTVPLEFVKDGMERNVVEGFDKSKSKPFNMTANHRFNKQPGSSQATQESIAKRSSRFESAKRRTHGHVLKTPDSMLDSSPLISRGKNGIINIKAQRDNSEPPLRVSKNNLMTSYEKAGKYPKPRPSKTSIQKDTKSTSKKQTLEVNSYESNAKLPRRKNKLQPKQKIITNNKSKGNAKPIKNEIEECKNSPSTMLLQSVGAKQLNTFSLPDKEEFSSEEIEEEIEVEDKTLVKGADKDNCITPL
jgi:hypothetical protein